MLSNLYHLEPAPAATSIPTLTKTDLWTDVQIEVYTKMCTQRSIYIYKITNKNTVTVSELLTGLLISSHLHRVTTGWSNSVTCECTLHHMWMHIASHVDAHYITCGCTLQNSSHTICKPFCKPNLQNLSLHKLNKCTQTSNKFLKSLSL